MRARGTPDAGGQHAGGVPGEESSSSSTGSSSSPSASNATTTPKRMRRLSPNLNNNNNSSNTASNNNNNKNTNPTYLISPPPSFSEGSIHSLPTSTTATNTQKQQKQNHQDTETIASSMSRESLRDSTELVFPTLTLLSPRSTPERELSSREGSPEYERSPSPEWQQQQQQQQQQQGSRNASPEVEMRPSLLSRSSTEPYLREMNQNGSNLNARRPRRNDSLSSIMSFDMVASYQSVAPADRKNNNATVGKANNNKTSTNNTTTTTTTMQPPQPWRPNEGLRKPITPSFIRDYADRPRKASESPYASGYLPVVSERAHSWRPTESREGSVGLEGDRRMEEILRYGHEGNMIASDPTASSDSGMQSFFDRLDNDRREKGWQYALVPQEGRLRMSLSSAGSLPNAPEESRVSLSQVYIDEVNFQISTLLRKVKSPIVSIVLLLIFSLSLHLTHTSFHSLTSLLPFGFSPPSQSNTTSIPPPTWGTIDFPTLMNIQSTFERVVDSSAGGSELARSLKHSEMAVSDLGIVVRHSTLACRATLAPRLDAFAADARANIDGLLAFASEVGGVLDSLLSVNEYALRELNVLSPSGAAYLPSFLLRGYSAHTHARAREIFDTAATTLDSNLRHLIASGTAIAAALDALAMQHRPIHEEIVRELVDLRAETGGALGGLWRRFGNSRGNFRENERLLADVQTYQMKARGYVEVTLMELKRMTSELDQLRRRVAEPLLVGSMASEGWKKNSNGRIRVEMKVQIGALKGAVDKLLRKRQGREERLRTWNRLILEREMRDTMIEAGGGRERGRKGVRAP